GAGDDILIDGTTDLDGDPVALAALRTEWAKNLNYKARVQNLSGSLSAASVHHDAIADQLTGDLDRDWFWAEALDVTDAVPSGKAKEKGNWGLRQVQPGSVRAPAATRPSHSRARGG